MYLRTFLTDFTMLYGVSVITLRAVHVCSMYSNSFNLNPPTYSTSAGKTVPDTAQPISRTWAMVTLLTHTYMVR